MCFYSAALDNLNLSEIHVSRGNPRLYEESGLSNHFSFLTQDYLFESRASADSLGVGVSEHILSSYHMACNQCLKNFGVWSGVV